MPRPTSGRLSRRAGGARNVVPPTARRSACLPSCWPTCLQRCFRTARCICNGSFCMRSSYATMNTAADKSDSSTGHRRRADEVAPPMDGGKSSNRPKPPPSPAGVLGQQASARGTSRGKSEPPSTLGSICELGRCCHTKQNQGKRQRRQNAPTPAGRRRGEASRRRRHNTKPGAAHTLNNVRHAATTTKDAGAAS